ncbi:putative major facilitator superfamily transporter [Polychaeton citri CBS 116435]|uniref:Major facilitator superfamily transporter n=1 Tax=Polychaeton citri CBS 116435 TaxID=1314669 RepID=A0A9P4QIG5_9PEZI|nr:putative major facilitator superfamily transporter [Polychaeton citri CBS 116435]
MESPIDEKPRESFDSDHDQQHNTHANENNVGLERTKSLEKQVSLPREILVIGVICLAQFTTQMGLGQTLSILHVIGRSFDIENPGILSWLIAGYSLTVGSFVLFSGRLGDLFGYKRMLVIGYCWFAIWSLVAGLSVYSNHVLFVFARVFQGIGPSICLPNGLALLGALYEPGKRKNMAFAMFGACAPGGCIFGALFAGLWSLAWWPWTFWSFAIALAIIAAVGAVIIPDPQTNLTYRGKTLMQTLEEMDILGAAVGITGLILFNFAWNQAPIVGWGTYVIAPLVLGIVFIVSFFYIEVKVSAYPLIPFDVLTGDNAFVLGCVCCGWSCFGVWIYYLWQQLEVLRGTSPLLATAYLSPLAISGACAAVTTGFLLSRLRPAWVMFFAMLAFLVGTILVATAPVHQIYWAQIFVCTLVIPWGMDMSFPAGTLVVSNSVNKEHQGVAASLVNTIVNYSISIALGFAGTVEVNVNRGGHTGSETLHGYRGALYMGIGLAGLGVFLSILFLLKGYLRDSHREQKEVDVESKEAA